MERDVRFFIGRKPMCNGPRLFQASCAVVRRLDGFAALRAVERLRREMGLTAPEPSDPDSEARTRLRTRSAPVSGATTEAIRAALDAAADSAHRWDFAEAECPLVIRAIHARECPTDQPHFGDSEGGDTRGVDRTIPSWDNDCTHLDRVVKHLC